MKAWILNENTLTLKEQELPILKDDQVLVQMKAWSLNYRDLVVKRGQYGKSKQDLIPLSDGAGIIKERGKKAFHFKPGDHVIPLFFPDWQTGALKIEYGKGALGNFVDGTLAEYVVFPEHALIKAPEIYSSEQAATLPCSGLTAWNALMAGGQLKIGQKVLLLGTGGVSIFALQIAKAFGAEVFITSGSDSKLEKAKALGANHLINYKKDVKWSEKIWEITEGKGVDLVIETGGAETFNQSLLSAAPHATISLVGVLSGTAGNINLPDIYRRMLNVKGIFVGSKENLFDFLKFYSGRFLRPVIDKSFNFEQADQAYEYLASQNHFGKVTITSV